MLQRGPERIQVGVATSVGSRIPLEKLGERKMGVYQGHALLVSSLSLWPCKGVHDSLRVPVDARQCPSGTGGISLALR